jgi:hypothetical protein
MNFKILALLPLLSLPLAGLAHEDAGATTSTAKAKAAAPAKVVKPRSKPKKLKPLAAAKKEHWVCPMHDGGESDHAGKCPKCGMDLVKEAI